MTGSNRMRTISRIAREVGVHVETVRYYERRGLIEQPPKPAAGYRIYPDDTVRRLRFIRRAQELGFTLAEIERLLELGDGDCTTTRAVAERKRDSIRGRIRDLREMERVLSNLVDACDRNDSPGGCPIIDSLADARHR